MPMQRGEQSVNTLTIREYIFINMMVACVRSGIPLDYAHGNSPPPVAGMVAQRAEDLTNAALARWEDEGKAK